MRELTLREVFHHAPELLQLADSSPVVTISLYRLLLAILHRSLRGPRTTHEWSAMWQRGAWDTDRIDAYLNRWHHRFDLFDPLCPFYQTPGLPVTERTGAATVLAHERASSRNQPLLFDHTTPDRAWLTPAAAARALLVQQNFAVGGLISYDSRTEPSANRFVGMAPLLATAICLVRGDSLFETLLLNLIRYSPADDAPFPARSSLLAGSDTLEQDVEQDVEQADRPAWERPEPTEPVARMPDGYVDLLTWQSRRILLIPAVALSTGETLVERAVLMKGYQLSADFARHQAETMLAFRASGRSGSSARSSTAVAARRAPAEPTRGAGGAAVSSDDVWTPLAFQPDRLIWRDSRLLFRSERGVRMRPAIFDWLSALALQGALDDQRTLSLDVSGMVPDQATIEEWRRESLPLPLAVLYDPAIGETVAEIVALAESVARLFTSGLVTFPYPPSQDANGDDRSSETAGERGVRVGKPVTFGSPLNALAEALLVGSPARVVERGAREQLVARFGAPLRYWSQLDTRFRRTLESLPHTLTGAAPDTTTTASAVDEARTVVMRAWAARIERVARQVFQQVVSQLGTSQRAMRAVALAQSRFNVCLAALLAPYQGPHSPLTLTLTQLDTSPYPSDRESAHALDTLSDLRL